MSEKFGSLSEARTYAENASQWREYLARKSLAGLRGQAQAALADQGLAPLLGGETETELTAICMRRYFPDEDKAVAAIVGELARPEQYGQGDLVRYQGCGERWTVDSFVPARGLQPASVLISRSEGGPGAIHVESTAARADEVELVTPVTERSIARTVELDGLTLCYDKGGDLIVSWQDGVPA
jgi:hypothetical protein